MNKHLRKLIGHYRQNKGVNFRELAELCGLNPKKWANKICNFEREGALDSNEMVHSLIRVLEVDTQKVRDAVQKDYEDWETWVNEPVPMELILKLIPAVYQCVKIPDYIKDTDEALEFACSVAQKRGHEACLALNRRDSIWIRADGTIKFRSTAKPGLPNIPYSSVGGKSFHFA